MGMNVNPLERPGFQDVQQSTEESVGAQEEFMKMQEYYKVKTAKNKSNSAIAKSMTAMFDECARRMA